MRLARWHWNPEIEREPLAETISQADGGFEISYRKSQFDADAGHPEPWREAFICAFKPGYGPHWVWPDKVPDGEAIELRLPVDDVAISGRLVDLEGRPLAEVRVKCGMVWMPKGDDLSDWVASLKSGESPFTARRLLQNWSDSMLAAAVGITPEVATDREGRFRLAGIGRERVIELVFEGSSIARTSVQAVTRKMPPVATSEAGPRRAAPGCLGPTSKSRSLRPESSKGWFAMRKPASLWRGSRSIAGNSRDPRASAPNCQKR